MTAVDTAPPAAPPQRFTYWTVSTRDPIPHPGQAAHERQLTTTLYLDPTRGYDVDTEFDGPGITILRKGEWRGESAATIIPWSNILSVTLEETEERRYWGS